MADTATTTDPQVTYFQPLTPGSARSYGNTGTCCGGTGLENHTKYQETIYLRSADGSALLRHNLFERILERPGATAVPDSPGEAVSRFRDDVDEVMEYIEGWTDGGGIIVSSIISVAIMFSINPDVVYNTF